MSLFPDDLEKAARTIIEEFAKRGLTIATAESCTGGLIAGLLTEIAGSSAVVDRGYVTYSNQAKMDMLGVPSLTLETYGAVSRETALAMAHGALYRSGASVSVAVTGIAGPGGGSDEKPVGLVHIAALARTGAACHREMHYENHGREAIRLATIRTALALLKDIQQHST
ncbi:nicotinamide-nucleotide amidohydrolase family protein [Agrobacterium vitis]|uniref:CinA family protein n=1 Tax=Rhizobium/Agrobacterium group TaxID=227290 RepID=UPI0008DC0BFB|nr:MULTISPECIES: CinA family protein [Rhizobium/Agrobacterium group]MCF1435298.1 CinA family protein [Allorhizobium ampelinum]MUO89862.1 nicotinamide-nucleotide amidohydrolase family protein [Agrobacterium vitis]MUZ53201.1 nicotinamide-nucleotide amidohydrolase family protein [Agrobacterium vitis]MUZ91420.1 nicotinamide-nucleotide amidohydrolase family protein [Agrobacterium vitis]MVA40136.1 nicotinamide-nucleotide amidohydrolase family protein [Agrobacterium vitis]